MMQRLEIATPLGSTPDRKRIMRIEHALKWAYGEELAQIPAIGGEPEIHGSHPMWDMARVDGGNGGGFDEAALRRLASPDAVEIAKTVHRLADPELLEAEAEAAGGLLDDGGPGLPEEHQAVAAALARVEVLVIVHARLGTSSRSARAAHAVCHPHCQWRGLCPSCPLVQAPDDRWPRDFPRRAGNRSRNPWQAYASPLSTGKLLSCRLVAGLARNYCASVPNISLGA